MLRTRLKIPGDRGSGRSRTGGGSGARTGFTAAPFHSWLPLRKDGEGTDGLDDGSDGGRPSGDGGGDDVPGGGGEDGGPGLGTPGTGHLQAPLVDDSRP